MLISILIPVRDDPEGLRRCLDSLWAQDLRNCQILICDDGSNPPVRLQRRHRDRLGPKLFRSDGKGPAAARNLLASEAEGDFLFFVDADTEMLADTLPKVRQVILENPGIGAFFGSYDDSPRHDSAVSLYKNLAHHWVHQNAAGRVSTFWCGCGIIRRQLFQEVGGLSESYRQPSIEDVELGTRLAEKGVSVHLYPQIQVKHQKRWTFWNWILTDLFRRGIPWVKLMLRRGRWPNQLNFTRSQRVAALAALVVPAAFVFAVWDPRMLGVGFGALVLFCWLNRGLLQLVYRKKGLLPSLQVIPLHLLYALICVSALVGGLLAALFDAKKAAGKAQQPGGAAGS
ncbi:MAG: glycosyltransferase family 2 protein [Acidobacteriota bacterium]